MGIQNAGDQVKAYFLNFFDIIKRRIFGANNERLDFIMDSFYKLSPNHQSGVLLGACAILGLVVMGAFTIYFSRINALEKELESGFEALQDVRSLSQAYKNETKKFDNMVQAIDRKTRGLRPKPFFEKKANQVGITISDLRSNESEIPADSPLSERFKYVNIDFKTPKVSIPRMLKFLGEIEKSNKHLVIQNLQVRTRYGDKLFFETQTKVVGYKTGG